MSKYFMKNGDHYLVSMAGTIAFIGNTVHDPEPSDDGRAKAKRIMKAVTERARAEKFEQVDILETMIESGVSMERLLPICDALVEKVGQHAVADILRRELNSSFPAPT